MSKKLNIILLITSVLIFIIGIGLIYLNYINKEIVISEIEGLTLEIKEGTLTPTGATIVITDNNSEKYTFGLDFQIQKLEDGKWKNLKVKKRQSILAVGYTVNENNKLEMVQDWETMYGKLPKGEYRLIKSISIKKLNFAVRFSI